MVRIWRGGGLDSGLGVDHSFESLVLSCYILIRSSLFSSIPFIPFPLSISFDTLSFSIHQPHLSPALPRSQHARVVRDLTRSSMV